MLSTEDKQILKEKLEREQALLEIELTDIGKLNPSNPSDWQGTSGAFEAGSTDNTVLADRFEETSTNEAIVSELEGRYNSIKEALRKMEDGSYGMCKADNQPIPLERLMANPVATTCINHEEQTPSDTPAQ